MFGGPFFSAGLVRIIDGVKYRVRYVSFAHWVGLMAGGDPSRIEIHRNGKRVATLKTDKEVEAFFDKVSGAKLAPPVSVNLPTDEDRAVFRSSRSSYSDDVLSALNGTDITLK